MMELTDMPGRSILGNISRWRAFNPKQVGGGFRGPFCASKLEVPTFFCLVTFLCEMWLLQEKGTSLFCLQKQVNITSSFVQNAIIGLSKYQKCPYCRQ